MVHVDFATVQWARKMTAIGQNLADLPAADLQKFSQFLGRLAEFKQNDGDLSPQQWQVIMQNLHSKELVRLEPDKGGALVEFTGGGFEFERFLIRADGKVPNFRYEAKQE